MLDSNELKKLNRAWDLVGIAEGIENVFERNALIDAVKSIPNILNELVKAQEVAQYNYKANDTYMRIAAESEGRNYLLKQQNEEMKKLLQEVSELLSWRDQGQGKDEALKLIYKWVVENA